jgi:hypothetical protein
MKALFTIKRYLTRRHAPSTAIAVRRHRSKRLSSSAGVPRHAIT